MMNEIQLGQDQENEAFGEFLIETIAKSFGVDPTAHGKDTARLLDRALYKGTDCGAWVKFDAEGILVGSIVEGSDAEFSERVDVTGIEMSDEGEVELQKRFWDTVERINQLACDAWDEANAETDADEG